jgi:hypothetical protein
MDRDNITRTGARAPGVKRSRSLERWCTSAPRSSTSSEDTALQAAGCTKDGGKPIDAENRSRREGPSDIPAFQPDWGKLTVRNDRGDHGNGGIIRSPIRAMVLPGRSAAGHGIVTEEEAIHPDRVAEVEGKLGHAVGGATEALQSRKADR